MFVGDWLERKLVMEEVIRISFSSLQTEVPIMVNMIVISVYLVLGGIYFTMTEHWELHESVYFSFITLTTIGFGDYVPGRAFYDSDEDLTTLVITLMVTIFYSIFGEQFFSDLQGIMIIIKKTIDFNVVRFCVD